MAKHEKAKDGYLESLREAKGAYNLEVAAKGKATVVEATIA